MPSSVRKSQHFSNTYLNKNKPHRCVHTKPRHKIEHSKMARETKFRGSKFQTREKHRRLIDIVPHAWLGTFTDPHWTFKILTKIGPKHEMHVARYSDFARLVSESPISKCVALPGTHYIPFLGKCFDTYDNTALRGKQICQAIQPLFESVNPERYAIDSTLLDMYAKTRPKNVLITRRNNDVQNDLKMARLCANKRRRHMRKTRLRA